MTAIRTELRRVVCSSGNSRRIRGSLLNSYWSIGIGWDPPGESAAVTSPKFRPRYDLLVGGRRNREIRLSPRDASARTFDDEHLRELPDGTVARDAGRLRLDGDGGVYVSVSEFEAFPGPDE